MLARPSNADTGAVFSITQGGDVTWLDTPCDATIIERRGQVDGSSISTTLAGPVPLPPGRYEAVVGCASDEGRVARAVAFTVLDQDDPVKVSVPLEPGFLIAHVVRYDTPVMAEVTVADMDGHVLAVSKDKTIIPLVPGRVRVSAQVVSAKQRTSHPIVGNAITTVVARTKTEVTVDTTDGALVVTLTDNGKKADGLVALRDPGTRVRLVELRAGERRDVPPGSYDLLTQLDHTHDVTEVVTAGIVVTPGKTTARTVAHRTGLVRAAVTMDGRRAEPSAPVELQYFRAGAEQPFFTGKLGEDVRVMPGEIEVHARRTDVERDDGSSVEARTRVKATAGGSTTAALDLSSALLEVVTQVGGRPRSLAVEVYFSGDELAVARTTTDAHGRAQLVVTPGTMRVRAVLRGHHGDVTAETHVVARGRTPVVFDLKLGTVMVQVFDRGIAVPAEVRFFREQRARRDVQTATMDAPQGAPVVLVPAGQEASLAPGTYAVMVRRRGVDQRISDIKVAAGRLVERTVELAPRADAPAEERTHDRPQVE